MARNFIEELAGYRVKVERNGRELVNVPGMLALPGMLLAPRMSIFGMLAAPFMGCSIHLENEEGREKDLGNAVKDAVNTAAETAGAAARLVKEEMKRVINNLSADDPEGCPEGQENEDAPEDRENVEHQHP